MTEVNTFIGMMKSIYSNPIFQDVLEV